MIDGHTAGWQSIKVTLAPTEINTGEDGRNQSERERREMESARQNATRAGWQEETGFLKAYMAGLSPGGTKSQAKLFSIEVGFTNV